MEKVISLESYLRKERLKAEQKYKDNPNILFKELVTLTVTLDTLPYWQHYIFRWSKHFINQDHPVLTNEKRSWCEEWFRVFNNLYTEIENWLIAREEQTVYRMLLTHLETTLLVQAMKWDRIQLFYRIKKEDHKRVMKHYQFLWREKEIRKQYPYLLFLMEVYLKNMDKENGRL